MTIFKIIVYIIFSSSVVIYVIYIAYNILIAIGRDIRAEFDRKTKLLDEIKDNLIKKA